MPEKTTTLPQISATEAPKEPRSRSERYWRRLALAGVVGAVALAGASGSAGKSSAQEVGGAAQLERSYVDRQDEVTGPQVHPIYIVPADKVDRHLDTDGSITKDMQRAQDWEAGVGRGNGLSLRMDTYQGNLDISFYQSPRTEAELRAHPNLPELIGADLRSAGYVYNPNKILLGLLDADFKGCGYASRPPNSFTNVALVDMTSQCGPMSSKDNEFESRFIYYFHEPAHNMWVVRDGAPSSNGNGHSKEVNDVMNTLISDTSNEGGNILFDPNHNDYWNDIAPWMDYNHYPVNIDIEGQGEVESDIKPNRYIGSGEPRTSTNSVMWFRSKDKISLGATPLDETWKFVGWNGAGTGVDKREVVINGKQDVAANFKPIVNYDLVLRGPGSIKVAGRKVCKLAGIKTRVKAQAPPEPCHYEFDPGSKVELRAVPNAKSRFVKWIGATSTKPLLKFTARHRQDKELAAVFTNTSTKRTTKSNK